MYFALLQERLLHRLRLRLRNGELTERSLARLTGISQPHVHNVLKGTRILSSDIADVILRKLGMSVLDLVESDELESAMAIRNASRTFVRVPLLSGLLGPGHPWPALTSGGEGVWIRGVDVKGSAQIVAVRLAYDAQMTVTSAAGRIALLDVSEIEPAAIDPATYYAISHEGQSFIRKIRVASRTIYALSDENSARPEQWVRIEIPAGVRQIVRGKVLLTIPLEGEPALPQPFRFLTPETSR